jgi:putative pyruvate formate lyase activating enzyme
MKMHISLMSQYYPIEAVKNDKGLNKTISEHEYKRVVDAFHDLGLYRGWTQELESHASYRPDFTEEKPFSD